MKNLNLENFGVQEMDAREMQNVDGGGFFGALFGFIAGVVVAALGGGDENEMFQTGCAFAVIGVALPF